MRLKAAILVLLGIATVAPSGQQPPPVVGTAAVEGEVLVKYRQHTDEGRRDRALSRINGRRLKRFQSLDIDHVRLPRGQRVEEVVTLLLADPDVEAAQPNYVRRATAPAPPNDPIWLNDILWGITRSRIHDVWSAYTQGDEDVIVADIDSGVKYDHPDLAANMWVNPLEIAGNGLDDDANGYVDDVHGINVLTGSGDPMDDHGHGTHTSGTFGAVGDNGIGLAGVNWRVRILACKFLDSSGSGSDAGAITCFNYITALKNRGENIRVSNNSWGGYRNGGSVPVLLKDAIDAAGDAGIINIAAAGNDGVNIETNPHDPASLTSPSIVTVGAVNATDQRVFTSQGWASNYGNISVDLAAPGVDIASTWIAAPPNCTVCYAYSSGTSMATPHVAGVAALLIAQFPQLTVAGIRSLLLQNVTPITNPQWNNRLVTGGRLNAWNSAVALNANQPPSVSITSPLAGTTFVPPATFAINATATDAGGVTSVQFLVNGVPVGVDTTSPYSFTATNLPTGSYSLTAVATDNLGAQATSPPVPVIVGIAETAISAAVTNGGTRLQQLQNADGGWYFGAIETGCGANAYLGGSCNNIIGVTALGLLSAYERTDDPALLADAVQAGELLESIHLANPTQQPFSQDLEFLRALSDVSDDPQYAALATNWFSTITSVHPAAVDRADWAFARRANQNILTLAVWDLASTIRSAKAAGDVDYATGLAERVIEREAEWKDLDPSHRWDQCTNPSGCGLPSSRKAFDYTLLGMGSFLWAVHDLPGFSAKIDEYRAWLLAQQDPQGTWDNGELQITAYVALGLGAVGGADLAIQSAVQFLIDHQLPNGGWPFWIANGFSGAEYSTVDSEITRAIDLLYSTGAGVSVTVAPAQLVTMTFDTVTRAGRTSVMATDAADLRVPPRYTLVEGLTYEAVTTASVTGSTIMCVSAPWHELTGEFRNVRLLQAGRRRFIDRTILKGRFAPNASSRRVCAALESLAPVSVSVVERATPPRPARPTSTPHPPPPHPPRRGR